MRVKKEKVPGTRSFVFIFRRSRARARASNRLRVRSVKILSKTVRSREGKRKTDKHQPNRFFIASCRKDLKFPPSIREGEKRKRIAGKRRRPFSSLEDFSRVRVWWLFRFKRTTKRTRAKFFSERWISFSLSVKSVKTRTAFLPDLGSVLTNLRQKGGVLERKNNNKNQHHRFKRLHTTERETPLRSHLY